MRIVLGDDHRLLLEALATALATHGITIEATATTPGEAVRAVERNDPDLLLLDVNFPSGSGLDAARHVVTHHPRTKVVMITGSDSPDLMAQALELGVTGYIRKVQPVGAIVGLLEQAMRGQLTVDPVLLRRIREPRLGATSHVTTPLDALTQREVEVLRHLVQGRTTREIMKELAVSSSTVRTHVQSIFTKLGVHSRLEAVATLAGQGSLDDLDPAHAGSH
jgi:two-component system, NarL family, nitrate/nitrite response regulator NarL